MVSKTNVTPGTKRSSLFLHLINEEERKFVYKAQRESHVLVHPQIASRFSVTVTSQVNQWCHTLVIDAHSVTGDVTIGCP